ncbi:M23 family metallopeptidase [Acinetobacter sp. RF15A]|uniref:M23 family metallopeptidase n=1 Tax=unclassified Acinetobacter TaxID=196816 RepID=UPI001191437E|nr:M23 family metallopeptidase [Acinetobacter sp. RF15A]TSI19095.1 M23 family metallopeptidase [Acinetobacter sp. RF15B]
MLFSLAVLLMACQPPPSGEAGSWKTPYLYWQLQKAELVGPLTMPVQGIQPGQIQDTWGAARSEGRKHQGIDIFARRGTAVLSTTQGIVRRVGTNSLGGKVIWITGPNLSHHYYAHLEDYAAHIQEGDWVEAGEVIAYVGNTGNAKNTPPHLHYGIYFSRQGATNPYPYLLPSS